MRRHPSVPGNLQLAGTLVVGGDGDGAAKLGDGGRKRKWARWRHSALGAPYYGTPTAHLRCVVALRHRSCAAASALTSGGVGLAASYS